MAKKYAYNEEGLTTLIMEAKKDETTVVKWNIHENYSSIDRDYGNWQSDTTVYSMILSEDILIVVDLLK